MNRCKKCYKALRKKTRFNLCNPCYSVLSKEGRKKEIEREKNNIRNRRYYERHKERLLQSKRKYKANNKEKIKAYEKEYLQRPHVKVLRAKIVKKYKVKNQPIKHRRYREY